MPTSFISEAHTRLQQRHSFVRSGKLVATSLIFVALEKNSSGAVGKDQHSIEALEPDAHNKAAPGASEHSLGDTNIGFARGAYKGGCCKQGNVAEDILEDARLFQKAPD